jgi:hypothetical protein
LNKQNNLMKFIIRLFTLTVLSVALAGLAQAQTSGGDKSTVAGGTNSARTDIYHVHVVHAVPGKAAELGESYKSPGPSPAPDHTVIFRHQYGDSWDYTVIGHYGTKLTIEAARQQIPEGQRAMSDSHTDTIVNGPSWAEFSRALGLGDDAKKTAGAVYIVSFYRASPGHRDQAEKNLSEPPDPAVDKAAGTVLMQHLDGAAWTYLGIVRYNSWQDMATSEANSVPTTSKANSPWSQMRESVSYHTDTLCDRIQ